MNLIWFLLFGAQCASGMFNSNLIFFFFLQAFSPKDSPGLRNVCIYVYFCWNPVAVIGPETHTVLMSEREELPVTGVD